MALFLLYLIVGYFVLPAAVQWQAEKQVREKLGHSLSIGAVRFDPLAFEFEVRDLALSKANGQSMLGLRRLFVDFELRRSLIDGVWTFAAATLEAPTLHFEFDKDGRHNFSALIERVGNSGPDKEPATALPRLAVRHIALTDGRVEVLDRLLDEPTVTRIEPLTFSVDALSTLAATQGSYRLRVPSAAGEVFETSGSLALNPVAAKGQLSLSALKVSTLVRALSRFVAIDAPEGQIDIAAKFDLVVDRAGQLGGAAKDVELGIAALSLSATGAKNPLLAIEQIALTQGQIDLGRREVVIANFKVDRGRIAASTDPQGRLDWTTLVRARADPPGVSATPAAAEAQPGPSAPTPWRVAVSNSEVAAIAVSVSDAIQGLSAQIDAVTLNGSPDIELGAAGLKMIFDKPTLSLAGLRLEQREGILAAPGLSLEAGRVSLATNAGGLDVGLDGVRIAAAQGFSLKQGQDSFAATAASLQTGAVAAMSQAGAATRSTIDGTRVVLSGASMNQAAQSATLLELSVESAGLTLQSSPEQFEIGLQTLRSTLAEMQARRGEDSLTLGKVSLALDKLALNQDPAGLRIELASPKLSGAGARAERGAERATLDEVSISSASASMTNASDGKLALALQSFAAAATGVAMNRGDDGIDLRNADVSAQRVSLAQAAGRLQLASSAARAALSGLAARQGNERIALDDGVFEAKIISAGLGGAPLASAAPMAGTVDNVPAASADASNVGTGFQARLDDAALRLGSLKVVALGATSDLGQVASANLTAKSLRLTEPDGSLDVAGDGLGAEFSDALLRSPRDASEVLRLGRATLTGAALRLRERQFSADMLTLARGDVKTWLDDEGRFSLLSLFGAAPESAAIASAAPVAAASGKVAPWRIAVKQAQVDDLAVGFEDRRESPAFALRLKPIRARVSALDTAGSAPMQLEVQAAIASGGDIQVDGSVHAATGKADLNVSLSGIALAPVQSYLSKFAELQLASGSASSKGRLRYGDADSGAQLAYQGSVMIERLVLEEVAAKRPFLTWDAVTSDDVMLTLQPNRLDVGELRVDKPAGRLIIAVDQSVNLTDVLKKSDSGAAIAAGAATKASADPPATDGADSFPVSIARLRVADGLLEFADLSLRPQFAARMHELKGVVTGLGTDPNNSAKLQLDARVDRYGSAKIRGQISVFEPERLTEIDMVFRNLEMTSLSPYVAKFAGYKVVAGRLALDLQYKVKDSKLLGTNKVVLSQVALGEKVESPDALDLPLELAIAILQDSKGVIDIGLPVSGDLSDPKFDYGAVIGKAIGNMLGGIVSAPFRALGALFGGGDKTLDTIAFEPGADSLAPPERQKLAQLARALKERPGLSLVVPPTYAAAEDTPVLKSLAVRNEIVKRMGIEVAASEDPGPIDVANARTQRAIEAVFSTRYAPAVLEVLKRRAVDTKLAAASEASVPSAASAASAPPAPPIQPPPAFYQGLVDRLINELPVSDEQLAQLATRRGEAVVRELTDEGSVPAARVVLGKLRQATDANDKAVALRLELGVKP